MYGFQDPERPVTAGWNVSSGFDLGRQSLVVEGRVAPGRLRSGAPVGLRRGVSREASESLLDADGRCPGRNASRGAWHRTTRSWPVASRHVSGGTTIGPRRSTRRWRTPSAEATLTACWSIRASACRTPSPTKSAGPGSSCSRGSAVDVNVWRRFTLRLAADLPILASRDYIVLRPKLSARVVVALGR